MRAIPAQQYKSWRPEVYNLTKNDYTKTIFDTDSDGDDHEEFGLNSI